MKSRHKAREVALQILYQYDNEAPAIESSSTAAFAKELSKHFDHFDVPVDLREFAAELVAGTLRDVRELDTLLEKHASNWKVARMASVDRCLLRMSAYELLHFKDTDAAVVIDEAIELAKQFGSAETSAFVNGVLDAIKGAVKTSNK